LARPTSGDSGCGRFEEDLPQRLCRRHARLGSGPAGPQAHRILRARGIESMAGAGLSDDGVLQALRRGGRPWPASGWGGLHTVRWGERAQVIFMGLGGARLAAGVGGGAGGARQARTYTTTNPGRSTNRRLGAL